MGFFHSLSFHLRPLEEIHMAKIFDFAKEKQKILKEQSKTKILEFLQDAGVKLEPMQMDVTFDDESELEIIFEPEKDQDDS